MYVLFSKKGWALIYTKFIKLYFSHMVFVLFYVFVIMISKQIILLFERFSWKKFNS